MLILTRKVGESVVIDADIIVTVTAIDGDNVRLGFTAPGNVTIHREEIAKRIHGEPEQHPAA